MQLDETGTIDVASLGGEPTKNRDLRRRGKRTVGKLLKAGLEVVEERGHDNARVDDIVERAEVSHGTFYLYFRDREDLITSLVQFVSERIKPLGDLLPAEVDVESLAVWFQAAERAFDEHVEVLRAAQSLGDDRAVETLIPALAGALSAAGGEHTQLVASVMLEHFARAIVRADILDGEALAAVALRAAGIEVATSTVQLPEAGQARAAV